MSSMKSLSLKWLGHSCFQFRSPVGKTILVDPFLTSNPNLNDAQRLIKEVDIITITHGHADHVGDTLSLYKEHRPRIVAAYELVQILESKGLASSDLNGMNIGGEIKLHNIRIAMTPALHSSTYSDGNHILPAGLACGYVFIFENGKRVYHAGDTWIFAEMEFVRRVWKPDIVLLPIGGHYTMDTNAARIAVELLSPQTVIPMHYDTFPEISAFPQNLKNDLDAMGTELLVPVIGQTLEI